MERLKDTTLSAQTDSLEIDGSDDMPEAQSETVSRTRSSAAKPLAITFATLLTAGSATALAGARTDLPSCDKAKRISTEDTRSEVEAWARKVCDCTKSKKRKLTRGQLKQIEYDGVCGTGVLSANPPAKPAPKPDPVKVDKPTKTKPTKTKTRTRTKVKRKGGKKDKKDEGSESSPETPTPDNFWIILATLFIAGVISTEAFLQWRNYLYKEKLEEVQDANQDYADALGVKINRAKGADKSIVPLILPSFKAWMTNRNRYRLALERNVDLEDRYNNELPEDDDEFQEDEYE